MLAKHCKRYLLFFIFFRKRLDCTGYYAFGGRMFVRRRHKKIIELKTCRYFFLGSHKRRAKAARMMRALTIHAQMLVTCDVAVMV